MQESDENHSETNAERKSNYDQLSSVIERYNKHRRSVRQICDQCNKLARMIQSELDNKTEAGLLQHINFEALNKVLKTLGVVNIKESRYSESSAHTLGIDERLSQMKDADEKIRSCFQNHEDMIPQVKSALGYEDEEMQMNNPCIAAIGQVKSGKSSLINCLLEHNVVAQKDVRCTARLTHLFYFEKTFVAQIEKSGALLLIKRMKHRNIPSQYLGLSAERRLDSSQVNIEIKAGVDCKILKQGIDIIDSPGLNENEALNELSDKMVKSLLPMIIYVIDGRKGLTEDDIKDIRKIKLSARSLQIVYFVTKLDPDARQIHNPKKSKARENAEAKLESVFIDLKREGFIAEDVEMENCIEFHGASLWAVRDHQQGKQGIEDMEYHVKRYERFQKCLLQIVGSHLEYNIIDSLSLLKNLLETILEKIIRRAEVIVDESAKKLEDVATIRREEQELFDSAMTLLKESGEELQLKMITFLDGKEERVLQPLNTLKYPDSLNIPSSGFVNDPTIIQSCQDEITAAICVALESEIRSFVEKEILSRQQKVKDRFDFLIQKLARGPIGKSSFRKMLELRIMHYYDLYGNKRARASTIATGFQAIRNTFEVLVDFIKNLFKKSKRKEIAIDVNSIEWRMTEGRLSLAKLDKQQFAGDVCNALVQHFEEQHMNYVRSLEEEEEDINRQITINDDVRQRLVELAPLIATQYMFCLDIEGRYTMPDLEKGPLIGEGAQGKVYRVDIGGELFAMKCIPLPIDQLEDAAMEVYYSSLFEHKHLLDLVGVRLEETEDEDVKKVCTISPLMRWDGAKYLKEIKPSMKRRIEIAIQVGEAVEYLHKSGIMHRDIKIANILVSSEGNAYVCDYGFLKPRGMANKSFVGTPIHIAPEIIRKEAYGQSVDVYSFGILLWYLADGTGKHPSYARYLMNIGAVLYAAAMDQKRPEKHAHFPEPLWQLMEKCWQADNRLRPTMTEVLNELRAIHSSEPDVES